MCLVQHTFSTYKLFDGLQLEKKHLSYFFPTSNLVIDKIGIFTLHVHARAGGYVIRAGVHLAICLLYVYMFIYTKRFE